MLAVLTVNSLADTVALDGFVTLREAIIAANTDGITELQEVGSGADEIRFAPSLFASGPDTILLQIGELEITEALTITGPGADLLTIDAQLQSRIVNITAEEGDFTIAGMTLTRGRTFEPEPPVNAPPHDGIEEGFSSSPYSGGAIRSYSSGLLTLDRCIITGSGTTSEGAEGGGVYAHGDLVVTNSTISGNSTTGYLSRGGGVFSRGNISITDSTISGNSTTGQYADGGGVYSRDSVSITDSTISGNSTTGRYANGGGVFAGYDAILTRTTLSNNSTRGDDASGGGIRADGTVSILSSTLSDNRTLGANSGGGGLFVRDGEGFSNVTIESSTISGNRTQGDGGGILQSGGSLRIAHSTVTNNYARGSFGGGIYTGGVVLLDHAIVARNYLEQGGPQVFLSTPSDISGSADVRHSLVGTDDGASINDLVGNLIGTQGMEIDPLLRPLADNGGPTRTHALRPNSPARDMGDFDFQPPPAADQRGAPFARVFGGRIDVGAYELQTVAALSLVVDTLVDENDGDYSPGDLSLREAIGLANGSLGRDTITFAAALTANGPATIRLVLGELAIFDAVTINGPGAALLTVDASGNDATPDSTLDDGNDQNDGDGTRVFNVDDGESEIDVAVTINGLTITGGDTNQFGGGIFNREELTLIDCIVRDSMADAGGGIHNAGVLTIGASTISDNQSANSGGGITNRGELEINDSTIGGNRARFFGGGVYGLMATTTVRNTTVSDNRVEQANAGAGGGGLATVQGVLEIIRGRITGNVVIGEDESGNGGGIFNQFGSLRVAASSISGNTANGGGGGISSSGQTQIVNSTISDNASGRTGGGIYAGQGNVFVASSTISGNQTEGSGGGLALVVYSPYAAHVEHTTITGNTADEDGDSDGTGGGVIFTGTGTLEISHSIIAQNNDVSGIAPDLDSTSFPVPGPLDVAFSLIGDATGSGLTPAPVGAPDSNGNLIGSAQRRIDPLLAALADNGGPTETHELLPGSPAINAGNTSPLLIPAFDQRGDGFDRVFFGRIDIGAFEFSEIPTNFVVDIDDDELDGDFSVGDLSLREALWASNLDAQERTITFAPNLNGATIVLTLGELVITDDVAIDATSLADGITVDASGNDATPDSTLDDGSDENDGDGTRVFNIDDGSPLTFIGVSLRGLTITGGDSNGFGGGILNRESLSILDCIITGNMADNGGGIASFERVEMSATTVSNNQSANNGGGINNSGSFFGIVGSTIVGNLTRFVGGGAFNLNGLMDLELSTVSENRAEQAGNGAGGGGLGNESGRLVLAGVQVVDNSTSGTGNSANGGGILNRFGELEILSSTIRGNSADGLGGGVANFGLGEIDRSTINDNDAGLDGGGVFARDGDFTLTSSTISGNRANRSGGGLLLATFDNYQTRITFATITANTADFDDDVAGAGGGISLSGDGIVEIEHTIVAANFDNSETAPDLDDELDLVRAFFSLIGDNTGSGLVEAPVGEPDSNGNLIGDPLGAGVINPRLAALADNGGPTMTHALQGNSPAVNAGDPDAVAGEDLVPEFDQRGDGFVRVLVGQIDIGAFELDNSPPEVVAPATRTIDEGETLTLDGLVAYSDADEDDTHTATIYWGDGTPVETATIDTLLRRVLGSHVYADNGQYFVTVTVTDNRGGVGVATIPLVVNNVNPVLTGVSDFESFEGQSVILSQRGFGISDPGFDNPLNAVNQGEVEETFTGVSINWGDGTGDQPLDFVNRTAGGPGVPTTARFSHDPHVYADNGTYTVTIRFQDDDGEVVTEQFEVTVRNVLPTLNSVVDQSVNEGAQLVIPDIGAISDPGADTFRFFIDWGDGSFDSTGTATIDQLDEGLLTLASFDGAHRYTDSGQFTVTIRVADDDMSGNFTSGVVNADFVEATFQVTVANVLPTLDVIGNQAVDEGTLRDYINIGTISDPGAETFRFFIDWGDGTTPSAGTATIDQIGEGLLTLASFDGSHRFADNGLFTVRVRVADDDMSGNFTTGIAGIDFVEATFQITVANVLPTLLVTGNLTAREGIRLSIEDLGTIADAGADTFRFFIDWGDGTQADRGELPNISAATFDRGHIFADNDLYTVTVRVADDDMSGNFTTGVAGIDFVEQSFQVRVDNVVPSLTAAGTGSLAADGTISIVDLGRILDPGFDNPSNPLRLAGSVETFRFFIDWGDGTPAVTGTAQIDVRGGELILTNASFDGNHVYATPGEYNVTLRVADDDMSGDFANGTAGIDFVEQSFVVSRAVRLVAPPVETPEPINPPIDTDPLTPTDPDDLPVFNDTPPPPSFMLASDGGSGGGTPPPAEIDLPIRVVPIRDEVIQAVLYRPQGVQEEELADAVFALGDIELVSLLGVDMGDDPVPPKPKQSEEKEKEEPVVVENTMPRDNVIPLPAPPEPGWTSLAFWVALAGGGTLWISGTWWWLHRVRKPPVN